jgi:hypothetical protein
MAEITFADLPGKKILIGITYVDRQENVLDRKQWWGVIEEASSEVGIRVALKNSSDPCVLPPDLSAIRLASPGEYHLKDSDEIVKDPDFITTWTCVEGNLQT